MVLLQYIVWKTLIIYDIMDTYEDGSHYRIYALFPHPIYSIFHYIFLIESIIYSLIFYDTH